MGRVMRVDAGEMVYHAWNRANFRSALFKTPKHYQDFLAVLEESLARVPIRLLAYCLMPNHWHLVLYPRAQGELSKFMQRITLTHTQRDHARTGTAGYGHVYQGRYKSLPVERGGPFMTLVRYVERNAQRAALVPKAEDWPWCSVHVRLYGNAGDKGVRYPFLFEKKRVPDTLIFIQWLNQSQPQEEIENLRYAIKRSRPYGSESWVSHAVAQFGLETTLRNPWRPNKGT